MKLATELATARDADSDPKIEGDRFVLAMPTDDANRRVRLLTIVAISERERETERVGHCSGGLYLATWELCTMERINGTKMGK